MKPVISEYEAKWLDEITINSGFCDGPKLMHNAGRETAIWFLENIPNPFRCKVIVVSGKGNNGGDGIVTHHYLKLFGVQSLLMLMDKSQFDRQLISDYQIKKNEIVFFHPNIHFNDFDWIIDALFGIGLSRDITHDYKSIINKINEVPNVISVDIPSGVYTDTGLVAGISVKSNHTITMGYKKLGHYLNNGKTQSGQIHVLEIGFKPIPIDEFNIIEYDKKDIRLLIRDYEHNAHKYSRGKALIIAGSKGMTGAGILAAKGANKIGCGLVKSIIPASLNTIFESELTEVITIPVEDESTGCLSKSYISIIENQLDWADATLVGPGLSCDDDSIKLITEILNKKPNSLILDATGFEPLIKRKITIADLPENCILTPHIGEFSKIFHLDSESVKNDPISAIQSIKPELGNRILVLKGSPTFITTGNGHLYMISNGSPLLATAGTGDVLAGMITGLIAQGYPSFEASILGTYIHAQTSIEFRKAIGTKGMIATDIVDLIPTTISWIMNEN